MRLTRLAISALLLPAMLVSSVGADEKDNAPKNLTERSIVILVQNAIAIKNVKAEYSRFYGYENRRPIPYSFDDDDLAAGENAASDPLDIPNDEPCVRVRLLFTANGQSFRTAWYSLENRRHIKQVIFSIQGVNPTNFSGQLSEENVMSDTNIGSETQRPLLLEFSGTSASGSIQEALNAALTAAQNAAGVDRIVLWSLLHVTGRRGGVAGFNDATVTINAEVQ